MSKISKEQKQKAEELRDRLAEDFDEEKATSFASTNNNKRWYEDFILLLNMLKDPDYDLSKKSKYLIMGTLAYVVLPVDIIPDFIPIVGWVDDVFILGYTMKTLKDEIDAYKSSKS